MAANTITVLPGYENQFGTKKKEVFELTGPAAYAAGGQLVSASDLGWGGFDEVHVPGLSLSGTFLVRTQYLPIDAAPSVPLGAARTVKLIWIVVATGAEVAALVDLSGEVIRVSALGV